ncbi:tripartite tricarboxylate transporter TctB family protein [Thermotoga profunda]|uniref:tripartite tricarboxylate transporter TctB family protein n=1 Tax=Thermotoga profunda TaxID=1508420 RepID=UPI0005971A9D|nr:tripartite tricarboxylate transporter TctB family protein [Thermotoga profunda]
MKQKDKWLGITVLVFGIIYTVVTLNLPRAPVGNPMGPIYFPFAFGILTAIIGLIIFLQAIRKTSEQAEIELKKGKLNYKQLLLGIGISLIYALLFSRLGFVPSTLIFLIVFLFILNGVKKWILNLSISVLYTFGVWYLFEKVFLISLP